MTHLNFVMTINPQCPSTYLVHNANIKDEIFICHLLNEAPWKAPFGKVTCAWNGLTQKLLSEKHDRAKLMEIEAKIMVEDNRAKELEQQQKRLEMEQEKHDAAMRHQQAQLEALNANQKLTQEVNLKVLEFMSMMASKLGDK